jgi:predicted acylesterase/phospholipase RssA
LRRLASQGTIGLMTASPERRIGLVLSAGGLRGASHLGVIRQLARHGIPTEVIVGTSVGALIAAYYAAVGLTVDEMMHDARVFRGRHLLAHSLAVRAWEPFKMLFRPWSGVIPERLAQLRNAGFGRLHHGVEAIGVVCHDLTNGRPRYLSTASDGGLRLYDAVATSAAMPSMFPPQPLEYDGQVCRFTDGGLSDPLPVGFASQPGLGATHVIVSDCRQRGDRIDEHEQLIYLRPRLDRTTTLRAPRATLLEAVEAGEAVVTGAVLGRLRSWIEH